MKTADKGNEGVPLSYAISATYNELLLYNYKNFNFVVKDSGRYNTSYRPLHSLSSQINMIKGPPS